MKREHSPLTRSIFAGIARIRRPIAAPGPSIRRRFQVLIALSVLVGALTGLAVAGVHALVISAAWSHLVGRDRWWVALVPVVGLLVTALILEAARDRSTETTEAYIRVFHDARATFGSDRFRLVWQLQSLPSGPAARWDSKVRASTWARR